VKWQAFFLFNKANGNLQIRFERYHRGARFGFLFLPCKKRLDFFVTGADRPYQGPSPPWRHFPIPYYNWRKIKKLIYCGHNTGKILIPRGGSLLFLFFRFAAFVSVSSHFVDRRENVYESKVVFISQAFRVSFRPVFSPLRGKPILLTSKRTSGADGRPAGGASRRRIPEGTPH